MRIVTHHRAEGVQNGITILENGLEISDTIRHNTDEPEISDTTNKNLCLPEDIFRNPHSSILIQRPKLEAVCPVTNRKAGLQTAGYLYYGIALINS